MFKKTFLLFLIGFSAFAQEKKIPVHLKTYFPDIPEVTAGKAAIRQVMEQKPELRKLYTDSRNQVEQFVQKHREDSAWMPSRLQMYWNNRYTHIYIKGGVFSHAGGQAPVPTVKFPGSRDHVTVYAMPKIEDIAPYSDDPRGNYLVNRSKPGSPQEWADPVKSAKVIESINNHLMGLAYKAAVVYWVSGEEPYADFALALFDTYMTGMYYRNAPTDLSNGHHGTIAGLSTYEVIQEVNMLKNLTGTYKFLYNYIQQNKKTKDKIYTGTFKKWADVQITNGVAFNNWNLMQAINILNIAALLGPDTAYADKKGAEYYIDHVLNTSTERQWSLQKLARAGFDPQTGLWNESPGYSLMVLSDFTGFVHTFDELFGMDILPYFPVLEKAALAPAQYLFPNGYITAFGDSYYRRVHVNGALELIAHAQKHGKRVLEEKLTRFVKALENENKKWGGESLIRWSNASANNLVITPPFRLDDSIPAGNIRDYITPVFYSPKVSYFAQRNGSDPKNGLMVAMTGSKGNHMHSNGISMEIFGKGMVMGPDAGIGSSYFSSDYLEYYSRFPAHNTVAVDGISNYPEMKSNHGFSVVSSYPASAQPGGYFPDITFGDLYFNEPETGSDQRRFTAAIRVNEQAGYYLDVFRSARRDGEDRFHDYFYHNIGQELQLSEGGGKPLPLSGTQGLSFSGGHLFAYDYFWDKKSVTTASDIHARFRLSVPGRENIYMNVWMKGYPDREVFSVKAPQTKSFRGHVMIPDSIAALPTPTLVVRQNGEAWKKPFVAVYEPTSDTEPSVIRSIKNLETASEGLVTLEVALAGGITDHIYNFAENEKVAQEFEGTFGLVRTENKELKTLFLGQGKHLSAGGYALTLQEAGSAVLHLDNGGIYLTTTRPGILTLPATTGIQKLVLNGRTLQAVKSGKNLKFTVPAVEYQKL